MVLSSMMLLLTLSDYYTIFTPVNKAKTTSRWNLKPPYQELEGTKKRLGQKS